MLIILDYENNSINRQSLLSFQYAFNYNVRDAEAEENGLFFDQTEAKNEETPDRTEGEYKVQFY